MTNNLAISDIVPLSKSEKIGTLATKFQLVTYLILANSCANPFAKIPAGNANIPKPTIEAKAPINFPKIVIGTTSP